MHSAFYAFFHHCAGYGIRLINAACAIIIVCAAASAANILCKAIPAALAREKTAFCKLRADFRVQPALVNIAHIKFFIARKLVAGVNIAVWHNGKVFVSGAARRNHFFMAYSALEVDIEMEEVEALAPVVAF